MPSHYILVHTTSTVSNGIAYTTINLNSRE